MEVRHVADVHAELLLHMSPEKVVVELAGGGDIELLGQD
jgi:hypothetical protein